MPETWNEMTRGQFMTAVDVWTRGVDRDEFLVRMFGLPRNMVLLMDDYSKFCIIEQTEWMRRMDKACSVFFIERLPGSQYEAPGKRLQGMTLEQFMLADNYFQRHAIEPENGELLSVFIAALYHAADEKEDGMERKVDFCSRLDEGVRQAVFMNFMLVKRWLSMAYPLLFPSADDEDGDGKRRAKPKPTDWLAVFDAFLGDDVVWIDRYKQMLALDAFRLMNRRIKNNKINR